MTLIEAIVALVILSAAFVAALEARVRLLDATRSVVERQRVSRLQSSLFREVVVGTVSGGELVEGVIVIEGEHLGEAYRVTVRPEMINNPVVGTVGYAVRERVGMLRYDVSIAGETAAFYWHRR
ncbi:MAG: hypothetical protein AAGH64_09485 [Planctomycetota bacterium]